MNELPRDTETNLLIKQHVHPAVIQILRKSIQEETTQHINHLGDSRPEVKDQ